MSCSTPTPPAPPEKENQLLLTNGQRRMLGFSLTLTAATVAAALLIFILLVVGHLLGQFSSVLWPLALAGVLALILRPAVNTLQRRLKCRRLPAVIALYVVFLLAISGLLVLVIPLLASQILDLIAYLPEFWSSATAYVQTHLPEWIQLVQRLQQNPTIASIIENIQGELSKLPSLILPSLKAVSAGLFSTLSFFTHFAVFPIYLFFFLLSRAAPTDKLGEQLGFLKPHLRNDVVFLVNEFIAMIVSFFRGQIVIGLIMGVLLGTGFTIVGLKFGFALGLILGLLNIVPYLGTIVGLTITVPLAFFQPGGGPVLLALVLLVYVIVQCIEGWLLTPKIMGDRTGLHPAVIIFAIFFWGTALNGILGMILAIPLTAFFVTFWRLLKHKYFDRRVLTETAPIADGTPETRVPETR